MPAPTPEQAALMERWVQRSRADALDLQLAERLHPGGLPPVLRHECEDGHSWRAHPDGGVSPSYGLAGTSIKFDGCHQHRCPEPPRFHVPGDFPGSVRGIACRSCDVVALPFDMLAGLSCTPWELADEFRRTGHVHQAPLPACGKPPVRSFAWCAARWIEVQEGVMVAVGEQIALL